MKKSILLIVSLMILNSCDWFSETWDTVWESDKDRFIETYTEILVVRGKYSDTAKANTEVRKVLEKHDYTEYEFRQQYFNLANDREQFLAIIDTARQRAKDELLKLQAQEMKNESKQREKELSKDQKKKDTTKDSSKKDTTKTKKKKAKTDNTKSDKN